MKEEKDIEAEDLEVELKLLSRKIENDRTPERSLMRIYDNNLEKLFPNVLIALRVLLTLPVSVANGEISLSKLKYIKTYLQTSMSQEK